MQNKRVLLTGATGFVGECVFPALVAAGYDVVCATRHPEQASRAHPERVFRLLDTGDAGTFEAAFAGCASAVYLIHGMAAGGDYVATEKRSAESFREHAERAGLERIVYLGGMRPTGEASRHLMSRLHTGEILRDSSVPTIELQASMVIGKGSESFRMVRDLSARLPVMVLPSWTESLTQPVAIADVVAALVHALGRPKSVRGAFGLPGPETISARQILLRTAQLLGRNPRIVGVPFVTPRLSSYWIRLITRADHHIADELVEGLRCDIVHDGPGYWSQFPEHSLTSFDDAVRSALVGEAKELPMSSRVIEHLIDDLSPKDPHGGQ